MVPVGYLMQLVGGGWLLWWLQIEELQRLKAGQRAAHAQVGCSSEGGCGGCGEGWEKQRKVGARSRRGVVLEAGLAGLVEL